MEEIDARLCVCVRGCVLVECTGVVESEGIRLMAGICLEVRAGRGGWVIEIDARRARTGKLERDLILMNSRAAVAACGLCIAARRLLPWEIIRDAPIFGGSASRILVDGRF